jgi:hypothetical protein
VNNEITANPSISVRGSQRETKPLLSRELEIRERHSWGSATIKHRFRKADRRARTMSVSIYAGDVTRNDPRVGKREGVTVNAVLVYETRQTKHDEPIEWLLLTSLPIASRTDVERVIEYDLQRWSI